MEENPFGEPEKHDPGKRPRRIEYEFDGLRENESHMDWNFYAKALEEYIDYLETKLKKNGKRENS